jgi:hypothetical protein
MGFYLQTPSAKRKADYLVGNHGALLLLDPEYHSGEYTTVCVVDNGPFEAAAVAYDRSEFDKFSAPDTPPPKAKEPNTFYLGAESADAKGQRPRIWLKVPTAVVKKLCPEVADKLNA